MQWERVCVGTDSSDKAYPAVGRAMPDGDLGSLADHAPLLQIFDQLCLPLVVTSPGLPDNPIVFANHGFLEMSGYRQDEIIGRNPRFLQGPDTDPAVIAQMRDAVRDHRPIQVEMLNYRKDGTRIWVALSVHPIRWPAGGVGTGQPYFVGLQQDLSERRRIEQERSEAAAAQQRAEAFAALASGTAHAFNNLMTAVLGSVDMARRAGLAMGEHGAQILRRLDVAILAAQQAGGLAHRMLAAAGQHPMDAGEVDLGETLRRLAPSLTETAGVEVRLQVDGGSGALPVRLDEARLGTTLGALVRNAAEALPEGRPPVVVVRARRVIAELVEITVEDQGRGMPPEVAARAAEPFFTAPADSGRTGLGLSIAEQFARQSGGALVIETKEGLGTTVRLRLPVRPGDAAA